MVELTPCIWVVAMAPMASTHRSRLDVRTTETGSPSSNQSNDASTGTPRSSTETGYRVPQQFDAKLE